MHILTPGYRYALVSFEGKSDPQVIQFIEKASVKNPDGAATFTTIHDGTTNEEVAAMLINRIEFLNARHPCQENLDAIAAFTLGLSKLNARTANRKARGVEGADKP